MKLGIGTAEEAEANQVKYLEEMRSKAKYTIGEAVKVDDETVEVSVSYERFVMNLCRQF